MTDNRGALCLRFDIDTFSTRTEFIADVGDGEYRYLPSILRVAEEFGVKFQFCACGQGLMDYPVDTKRIQLAGHPVDSHLYTHCVMLIEDPSDVDMELQLTEEAFSEHGVHWTGIGATGGHKNGIDDHPIIIELLVERGYQWCSTKYNNDLSLEQMQPYKLNESLLEIPMAGMSDRHYFYDTAAPLEAYINQIVELVDEAIDKDLIYVIPLHPGVLSKFDPECKLVSTVVEHACRRKMPIVTMAQICRLLDP